MLHTFSRTLIITVASE